MAMGKEFIAFLKVYGVIGLAIAVIIGGKLNDLVSAVVKGLLMPIIGLLPIGGDWQTWGFDVREQHFAIGPVIGAAIDFLIVAWLVFWLSRKVLREDLVTKK
jgi:large conductance mechanosensitive channel